MLFGSLNVVVKVYSKTRPGRNRASFFPKASLMLGFCFRFSLKVPGSDTSCDDGDKKGFPFRCAADRACDAGWGCRPGVRGWLGDGGEGLAGCARLARWTLVTSGNRPRARRARGTLVTGGSRPRARLRGNRPRARLARWTLVTSGNRPRARRARGTLVTGRKRDGRGGRS